MTGTTVTNGPNRDNPDYNVKRTITAGGEVQHVQIEAGFTLASYDYVGVGYPSGTQEVYTFKVGGSGGTTVNTLTVDYTDATKGNISAVTKT